MYFISLVNNNSHVMQPLSFTSFLLSYFILSFYINIIGISIHTDVDVIYMHLCRYFGQSMNTSFTSS